MTGDPGGKAPITVLGATGSIGVNTLSVVEHLGIPVHAVTANRKADQLAEQARRHRATLAVVADEAAYPALKRALAGSGIEAACGEDALVAAATAEPVSAVVTAIVGAAGLRATLAAARAGKRLCIANKEPLVMAGALIMAEARRAGCAVLPVDSEHSAIFQCLAGHGPDEVRSLILTASGGPLRTVRDLAQVSRELALTHPTWSMGPKITIDSATLMNKSLEIIEAHWLFDIDVDRIQVVIHPQSVIHSMVAFADGSVLAQLGLPDMRVPIQYALTWPKHAPGPVGIPDFTALGALTFEAPDTRRFPSITYGFAAARAGGLAPAVMNAANEMAVARYLRGEGRFIDIFATVESALAAVPSCPRPTIDDIIAADRDVRARLA